MNLKIVRHPCISWATFSAKQIQDAVSRTLTSRNYCSVMLTGGRSSEKLMLAWSCLNDFFLLSNVHFFWGDERCVPPDHKESNFGLAMRTLFRFGIPAGCVVERIKAEFPDRNLEAYRYERQLPEQVDILLLGVGEDGHIASIFPGTSLCDVNRKVVAVKGPKTPADRITVTPQVIRHAREVFVLATDKEKSAPLREVMYGSSSIDQVPARLLTTATWLIDFDVPEQETSKVGM